MSFWTSAWSWVTGSSASATLAKTAALGFAVKLMSDNVNKDSNTGSGSQGAQDSGARIQLNPDPQNKIPVLYGSAFFGGNITDVRLSADQKTITYCLALAEQTGNKINGSATGYVFEDLYLNNNRVVFKADGVTVDYTLDADGNQDISARDLIKVYMYAAGPKQPDGYSGTTPAADTIMPGWTAATHPMTGLVYAIVSVTYNRAKNVVGLPDCKFHLTSDMTLPGDVLRDYMTSTRYGAGIDINEIDSSLTALNTYADTGFTYTTAAGVSSTAKISINGLVDTSSTVMDVMEELAAAANSWISYNIHKGQWTVVINKEGSSVASLSDDNIIGEISIGGTSLTQLNNVADVKYQNARILDKEDYVKVSIPTGDLFQNEPRSDLQIALPYTNQQAVALRIGLQQLKQARVDKIINFATDYSYVNITAGDIVAVTSPVFGYTNKLFRVVTVAEEEGDDASLQIRFTCLEYDADVYTYNITEFNVETQDGILNIGSIGKPGTPQATKFERDARPRVRFESVSPSGIVEGLEFWITNDVTLPENQRNYRLLATRYPDTNVTETWPESSNVVYEDDALPTSDFYVKTRGINALVVGPFSDPSGLIAFVPEQVTDGIGPDTQAFDATGGLLTALAVIDLLKGLDELYQGVTGNGSIFKKVFDLFKEITNVDLIQNALNGFLGPENATPPTIKITAATSTVSPVGNVTVTFTLSQDSTDFTAGDVTVTGATLTDFAGSGKVYTAKITPEPNFASITITVPAVKFSNADGIFNQQGDSIIIIVTDEILPEPEQPPAVETALRISELWPPNRATFANPVYAYDEKGDYVQVTTATSDFAPLTGSYYIKFAKNPGLYGIFTAGDKTAKLYKSDGTLVQTLVSGSAIMHGNVVELPFSAREYGTDYYILVDPGFIKYCDINNTEINDGFGWNFNTPLYDVNTYGILGEDDPEGRWLITNANPSDFTPIAVPAIGVSPGSQAVTIPDVCKNSNLIITYKYTGIEKGLGNAYIHDASTDAIVGTIAASTGQVSGGSITFGSIESYVQGGKTYYVTADQGLVKLKIDCYAESPSTAIVKEDNWRFVVADELEIDYILVDNSPWVNKPPLTHVNRQTNIRCVFNRRIFPGESGTLTINSSSGVHQTIDIKTSFANNKTSEIVWFSRTWHPLIEGQEVFDTIVLNPTKDLDAFKEYWITATEGVAVDSCGQKSLAVTDVNKLRFKTDGIETADSQSTPVPPDTPIQERTLEYEFDRPVTTGTGSLNIYDDTGALVKSIPADSPLIQYT